MRRVPVLLAAAGLGAVLAGGVAATADSGDGKLGCNTYEICFSRDAANTTYQKHFYNGGSHSGYTFTNVNTGAGGQGGLQNNAAQVRNRDGSCTVRVIDDLNLRPDDYHDIANNGVWTQLKGDVINENDKHERRC